MNPESVAERYYGAENLAPGTYLSALELAQQDKYEARALFTLAETLRFTITRNAPSMDKQVRPVPAQGKEGIIMDLS